MDVKSDLKLKDEDPVFITQQTDSMFILTSHLTGYGRRNIKIEINEDGSRITISGDDMPACEVVKKREELRGFRKTFTIPEGVVLDKVKARFDQDESRLTIRMPKSVKGVVGIGIQEVKDVKNLNQEILDVKKEEIVESNDLKQEEEAHHVTQNQEFYKPRDTDELKPDDKIQSENEGKGKEFVEENDPEEVKPPEKSSIICIPIVVGSSLFLSLIVVVLSLIRSKNGSREKRN